jgi:hypothetical protein
MAADILALDLATMTGYARGLVRGVPDCGTVNFAGRDGASDNAIFGNCLQWLSGVLQPEPRPSLIIVEEMLPPQAMQGETNTAARDRLAGLHGIVRAVAYCRGIYDIKTVSVLAVRKHFCGTSRAGKDGVREQCQRLGWPVTDHNSADAAAVWDYGCALFDPTIGIARTPLFRGIVT